MQWTGLRHTLQTLRQRPRIHSKGILWAVANKQTLKRAWAAVPGELWAGSSLLKARLTLLKVCVSFGYLPYVATALTLSSWFVISKLSSYEGTSQGGQGISSEPPWDQSHQELTSRKRKIRVCQAGRSTTQPVLAAEAGTAHQAQRMEGTDACGKPNARSPGGNQGCSPHLRCMIKPITQNSLFSETQMSLKQDVFFLFLKGRRERREGSTEKPLSLRGISCKIQRDQK